MADRAQDTTPSIWTVIRLIRWTAEYLAGKGVETPRLDAEVLLADLLGLSRVGLYLNFDRPLQPEELAGFRERVRRRASREPVAYIIGRKEFYSLDLEVGPSVLIPRPETELLVDEALRLANDRWPETTELRVADIGTGSGAVAVALASALNRAVVWAVDVSDTALEVARRNAARCGCAERIHFLRSDLFSLLPVQERGYHLITANLPYVPRAAFADMSPDVREFEPHLALDGGEDGLDLIRRAVAEARPRLESEGALLLEIWPDQAPLIRQLADWNGYHHVTILKDLADRDRVAVLHVQSGVNGG